MKWIYKSPIGTLSIIKQADGRYYLTLDNDYYGPYPSAEAAASDVYTGTTGCSAWDDTDYSDDAPTDLSEWLQLQ